MRFEVLEQHSLNASVRSMTLAGATDRLTRPGQFVQVRVPGCYLRRPISVCDWQTGKLRLVYQIVGEGTERMSHWQTGDEADLLPGLGNGFDMERCGETPLLVGGGVGLPPLLGLCRRLLARGARPQVLAGFASKEQSMLLEDFQALGVPVTVTTVDGSLGIPGLVTDALDSLTFDSLCACGPIPMMRALHGRVRVPAQYSLEERMGCGFGACMGCSIQTKKGPARVCKEGPVFNGEELMWA